MAKNYFLIMFLCNITLFAQESISISGPNEVEVGKSYNFTFSYSPDPNIEAKSYRVLQWQISTVSHLAGEIPGHINNQSVGTYTDSNTPGNLTIPIQWGSGVASDEVNVSAIASGELLDENGYVIGFFDTDLLLLPKNFVQLIFFNGLYRKV